jgi:hypothetical protein
MTTVTPASYAVALSGRLRPVWPVLASGVTACLLLVALTVIARGDEVPLFLVHLVVLVLAAGAAYLLDDTAREVTEVVPRSLLRRRTTAVAGGAAAAAGAWGLVLLLLHWRSPSAPLVALTWEVAGVACVAVAAAAVTSLRGEAEPGNMVASALALAFVGTFLVQPMLPFRLLATAGDSPSRAGCWAVLIGTALVVLVLASRDRAAARAFRPQPRVGA